METKRSDRILEVLDVVMLGFLSAVPLACVAFVVHRGGWHTGAMLGFPLYCAWAVGRHTARSKWMRVMDARIAEIDRTFDRMSRTLDEEEKRK